MKTITKFFPKSTIGTVHQDGTELTERTKGVAVHIHIDEQTGVVRNAEILGGDEYADIGLQFNDEMELVDFDGVFSLPREVGEMLTELGYKVSENCY